MRFLATVVLAVFIAGCAGFSGRGLVPGQATEQEVEALMGPSADVRKQPNGDTVRFYSRQPYGREIYAARIGRDGKLVSLEQRLTEDNLVKLQVGTRAGDVRELIGPPYRVDAFPGLQREVWTYKMHSGTFPKDLYVQFSTDGLVREVMMMDDPQFSARDTHM
jgi:hypothetical protein